MSRLADVRNNLAPYFGLTLAWLALVLLVNPLGDFPISDDWAYAKSVRDLLSTGQLKFNDWAMTNMISHVAWGALFGSTLGPSYTVLRLSTLLLALGNTWAVFYLCRRASVNVGVSLLATATSILNPIYFFCSFSFMTDVPYAAMQMIAVALLASSGQLVRHLGWAAAVWGLLCRQTGLAIAAAWGIAQLRSHYSIRRAGLAVAAVSIFMAIQVLYQYGLRFSGIYPQNLGTLIKDIVENLIDHPFRALLRSGIYSSFCIFYIGLFSLPITISMAFSWFRHANRRLVQCTILGWLALTIATCFALLKLNWLFPMFEDTISQPYGIGTEDNGVAIPNIFEVLLTAAAAGGAVIFLPAAIYALTVIVRAKQDQPTNMLAVLAIALFLPITFVSHPLDRYLIPILPCIAVVLAVACQELRPTKRSIVVGLATACFMAVMSVAATHDFLAWKRVQKVAYAYALTLAPAQQVDAGWVLNGVFPALNDRTTRQIGQDYRVSPRPEQGYKIIRRYAVSRWLVRDNELLVLRRLVPPSVDAGFKGSKRTSIEQIP